MHFQDLFTLDFSKIEKFVVGYFREYKIFSFIFLF